MGHVHPTCVFGRDEKAGDAEAQEVVRERLSRNESGVCRFRLPAKSMYIINIDDSRIKNGASDGL